LKLEIKIQIPFKKLNVSRVFKEIDVATSFLFSYSVDFIFSEFQPNQKVNGIKTNMIDIHGSFASPFSIDYLSQGKIVINK
jgi:hypothetical protein